MFTQVEKNAFNTLGKEGALIQEYFRDFFFCIFSRIYIRTDFCFQIYFKAVW